LKAVEFFFDSEERGSGEGAAVWILDRNVEKCEALDPFGQEIVRKLLGRNLNVDPEQIVIERNSFGRPMLGGGMTADFNVAHAANIFVLGLSPRGGIGVDVEIVGQVQGIDLAAVARDYFSQAEMMWVNSFAESERMLRVFQCWTAKEALVKAVGCGLSVPLAKIETQPIEGEEAGVRIVRPEGWRLVQREVLVGAKSAVVAVVLGV
jgi:phosphopantetheinyl transferase